jgi:hypothetical protein
MRASKKIYIYIRDKEKNNQKTNKKKNHDRVKEFASGID